MHFSSAYVFLITAAVALFGWFYSIRTLRRVSGAVKAVLWVVVLIGGVFVSLGICGVVVFI
jgi:hypothetical protein